MPETPEPDLLAARIVTHDFQGEIPQTDCKSILIIGSVLFTCSKEGVHLEHREQSGEDVDLFYRITWADPILSVEDD